MATMFRRFGFLHQYFPRLLQISCPKHTKNPPQLKICRSFTSRENFNGFNRIKLSHTVFGTGLLGAGGLLLASSWFRDKLKLTTTVTAAVPVYSESKDTERGSARHKFNFIADVVEKAVPAVVYIEIQGRHPFTGKNTAVSNGSGFIVREDGLIITNAHVVANKHKVVVRLHDGRSFDGYVQAVDQVSDLATVKINAQNLPTLKFGKSGDVRPGEWVVAMGSPFQLSNTVTAGIVSSVHRGSEELGLHGKGFSYIQTDAVINFGNSGGPLVNLDGEAIGISSMKVTTGISFAIPADHAQMFLTRANDLEKQGTKKSWFGGTTKEKRRYMGISMLTLTPSIINELQLRLNKDFPDVTHGVLVHKVVVGSPAFSGGLRPGDVITQINGKEVSTTADVFSAVDTQKDIRATIQRGMDTISLNILPEEVE